MPLKENEDYYTDKGGLLVFTEKYLLERGFCCQNGCRHCPYGKDKEASKSDQDNCDLKSNLKHKG